ncbi:helix-turn-helix domain-containing protein [Alloyangia pacifica]|uniref:helix-turn-helix domain-containing protein n=1 Tax=Alloyangia pacifica TaxID=311180 RepID=UPI000B8242C3
MGAVYAQLSVRAHVQIERGKLAKVSVLEMARVLQRSKATICRELKRNWFSDEGPPGDEGYHGAAAHKKAINRRARQRKLICHPQLRNQKVRSSGSARRRSTASSTRRKAWRRSSSGTCPSTTPPAVVTARSGGNSPGKASMSPGARRQG